MGKTYQENEIRITVIGSAEGYEEKGRKGSLERNEETGDGKLSGNLMKTMHRTPQKKNKER